MLNGSVSPHIRNTSSTATVMRDVAIALIPPLAVGVFVFGLRALVLILVSAATCMLTEYVYEKLLKLPVTVADGSALVTGLILAMNLPATVPVWVPVMGGVFAIVFVKLLFGGLGQNMMNPALAARCFLIISFPALMGGAMPAVGNLLGGDVFGGFLQRMGTWSLDATASATPLALLREGQTLDLWQAFFGFHSGCIGETSTLAILVGAAYLLARRVISPRIPAVYVGSTLLFVTLFRWAQGGSLPDGNYLLGQLVSGGLMAGAVYMATDYVTSPITAGGQWLYALLLGLLTALFRVFGSSPEGVSYAIIIGNTLVPLMERATLPRPFGTKRAAKGGSRS